MGNSLADRVIQANEQEIVEKERGDKAPEGYYTDDLGFWVEQDIRRKKQRFAEYILFRCRKLNPHLHLRGDLLFNSHTLINKHPNDIAELAQLPETITFPAAAWVYNKLLTIAPPLDDSRILVAEDLVWNMETCEFEDWSKKPYSTVS